MIRTISLLLLVVIENKQDEVDRHVQKLFKGDNKGLRGLDVKENPISLSYNYKDLYNYRYDQDGDLVLDYQNSDTPKFEVQRK